MEIENLTNEQLLHELLSRASLVTAPTTVKFIDPTYKVATIGVGNDYAASIFLCDRDLNALKTITKNNELRRHG